MRSANYSLKLKHFIAEATFLWQIPTVGFTKREVELCDLGTRFDQRVVKPEHNKMFNIYAY